MFFSRKVRDRPVGSKWFVTVLCALLILVACAPQSRMGMVVDRSTGLQFGSAVERNIVLDASQFANRHIKVRIRNTSGDSAFDLKEFKTRLENSYRSSGYRPTDDDDFGILLDVNVVYSGQASRSLSTEFAFLGGATGGIVGARGRTEAGTAIGILSGVALGSIVGTYVSEDTYIVVAQVSLRVGNPSESDSSKTIVFDSSKREESESASRNFKPFRERIDSGVSVYAGGRSIPQSRIAEEVRNRFVRILSDII
jgi:hypothetical protein